MLLRSPVIVMVKLCDSEPLEMNTLQAGSLWKHISKSLHTYIKGILDYIHILYCLSYICY